MRFIVSKIGPQTGISAEPWAGVFTPFFKTFET